MPHNKTELEGCLLSRLCESRKPGIRTHVSHNDYEYDVDDQLTSSYMYFQAGSKQERMSMLLGYNVQWLTSKSPM